MLLEEADPHEEEDGVGKCCDDFIPPIAFEMVRESRGERNSKTTIAVGGARAAG